MYKVYEMNNICIACCVKGVPIHYNTNEKNIETVFGLTILPEKNNVENISFEDKYSILEFISDFELIQNVTFRYPISPNKMEWNLWKETCKQKYIINVEEGYLYYSFQYQISFAHYLTQTLPLLVDFLQKASCTTKLLVPAHTQTKLQKEILSLLHIPEERIQILEENQLYRIKYFYNRKLYETPPNPFTQDHIWIFNELRKGLNIVETPKEKNVYLRRDGRANPDTNNSESGSLRQIKNESDLIYMLQTEFDFEVITLGDKCLQEKTDCLAGIRLLVTPLGANCMNLVFAKAPSYVLLLSNDRPIGNDYYIPLASVVNQTNIPFTLYTYPIVEHSDPLNRWNGSFYVDIDQVREYIKKTLS
jgi:hypothetical protein